MKKLLFLGAAIIVAGFTQSRAQVSIGQATPDGSAMLDVVSNSRGMLIPRMMQALRPATPANGLLIYQTDGQTGLYYYDALATPAQWRWIPNQRYVDSLAGGAGVWAANGANINNTNAGNVGIGTGAPSAKTEIRSASDITTPQLKISETAPGEYSRIMLANDNAGSSWTIAGSNTGTPANDQLNFYNSNAGDVLQISGLGNVGIGTAPQYGVRLSLDGGAGAAITAVNNSAALPAIAVQSNGSAPGISIIADNTVSRALQAFSDFGTGGYFSTGASGHPLIAIGGKSGFGTATPQEMVDVNGAIKVGNTTTANAGAIRFTGSDLEGYVGGAWHSLTGGTGATNYWTATGNDIANNNSGNVGIGTPASTNSKLNVSGANTNTISASNSNTSGSAIYASATGATASAINVSANSAGATAVKASSTNGIAGSFTSNGAAALVADGGSVTGKSLIVPQGRSGFGILSPTETVDVNGGIRVGTTSGTNAGTIRYNGSDLQGYVGGQWRSLTDTGTQTLSIAGSQLSISSGNSVTLPSGGAGYWTANGNNISNSNTGKVGIGTSTPAARLQVADSSVVFTASGNAVTMPGAPPVSGTGRRMMWYADKGAFRAGLAFLNGWDKDSVGNYSFAAGEKNVAAGRSSTALGNDNSVIGNYATAAGGGNVVTANWGTAFGVNNTVNSLDGVAIGNGNTVGSFQDAHVFGVSSAATGYGTTAIGMGLVARTGYSTVIGAYNDSLAGTDPNSFYDNEPILIVGNGTSASLRHNAMVVSKGGDVGIGSNLPNARLAVSGNSSINYPQLMLEEAGDDFARLSFRNTSGNSWTLAGYNNSSNAADRLNFYNSTSGDVMSLTGDGKVGIGTTSPGAKLEVAGQVKISGGTPGAGKVLTSDAIGLATWQTPAGSTAYMAGSGISISGGSISATDNSATNEIQSLLISGNQLSISGGNMVTLPSGGAGWSLSGNSSTSSATNFIGTSDNQDLVFRRNNQQSLKLAAGGALLATGSAASGVTPASGAGVRMMWIPAKAAFRAGYVSGMQWDDDSIGVQSFAGGYDNTASGQASFVFGGNNNASGTWSGAIGNGNTVSGSGAFASGSTNSITSAIGFSQALGLNNVISGDYATAIGGANTVSGQYAEAIGYTNRATAYSSKAIGDHDTASGLAAIVLGVNSTASGSKSVAIGSEVNTNGKSGTICMGDAANLGTLYAANNNSMYMRFSGGYYFYTASNLGAGVYLQNGDNYWAAVSDRRKKENFLPANGELFLQKVAALPLSSWNYKGQEAAIHRHYGPMAQDFHAAFGTDAFGLIGNDTTINEADLNGVSLIAIQALEKRTHDLQQANDVLSKNNAALTQRLETLEAALNRQQALIGQRLHLLEAISGSPQPAVSRK